KSKGEGGGGREEGGRGGVVGEVRGVTPALEESDIPRERLALEESIRKVEAEAARQFVEASRQMSAAKIRQSRQWDEPAKVRPPEPRPAEPRRWDEGEASAPRRYVSPPQAPQDSAPAAPQDTARKAWSPAAPPRSDSFFDRPLPPSPQPPPPAAREAGAAAEHRSLFDAAPEDALGVAAEEVGGAPQAEQLERAGDTAAPAPDLDRGRGFFNRLKFGRSEPRRSEPQAREERMLEPPPPPPPQFARPMPEASQTVYDP